MRLRRADGSGGSSFSSRSFLDEQKTFVVTLKGLARWISRVHYEKNDKDLKLFFTLQHGNISPENLSLQMHGNPDLTIIVGEKEYPNSLRSGDDPSPKLSGGEAMAAALELLSLHPDILGRMMGAVLGRLKPEENLKLYHAFLAQEYFREYGKTPRMLPALVQELSESIGSEYSYLILHQSPASSLIQGLLWTKDQGLREQLLSRVNGRQKGNWLLFSTSGASTEEIINKIPSLR